MKNAKFSQNLIMRITTYFEEKYGFVLSENQASEYLEDLANLYLALTEKKETAVSASAPAAVSHDLIFPHSCK